MKHARLSFVATLAVVLAPVAAGCSSDASSAANTEPTTGSVPVESNRATVTLSIGTDDSPGVPSADQIQHFVAEVDRLSDGQLVIEPKWHAEGDGQDDWDQAVARMVTSGELDLALGPTWAWDVLGVNTLKPIQSPFLVDSDQLVADIVTNSELSDQLLAGLPAAGVQGISLWPEGLRHPFGFDHPLLTTTDYDGEIIRSPVSDLSTAIFETVGATTSPADPDASTMTGMQSEYKLSPNGTGVANITWFPKVNLLYANTDVWSGLGTETQQLVLQAAASTQAWAIEQTDDVAAGQAFCANGGEVVMASAEQVDALKRVVQPVADALSAENPDSVAAITELKRAVSAPIPAAACRSTVGDVHTAGTAEAALNGSYRYIVTTQDILDHGGNEGDAINNEGVQNFTMKDGAVSYQLDPTGRTANESDVADGTYQVDGDMLTLRFPTFENEVDTLRFEVDSNGNLIMTSVDSNAGPLIEFLLTSKPWERIE